MSVLVRPSQFRRRRSLQAVALLALAPLMLIGCGGDSGGDNGSESSGLEGTIEVDGSSTVYPISEKAATEFRDVYPGVEVTVGVSGTGGGFQRFTKGETDISDASRPIKAKELEACRENKVSFVELPVAYDGLTIVVNPKNDFVTQMTIDDLKKIFRSDSAVKTWKEVNDAWPDEKISIFAPGTQSGTFDYFKEVMVGKDEGVTIRDDMNTSEDDNQIVTGVSGDEHAIGFFGVAYYVENKDKVKAVPVVNPKSGTAVMPDADKIESGEYAPFSRPLFIYVAIDSITKPQVKEFVEYYLEHAKELAPATGYVALPESVYAEATKHYKQKLAGTHFLTEDMESKSGAVTELYKEDSRVE